MARLTPFGRGTASFAEPGNNPEQILIIESPNFGAIPLVRTVVSVGTDRVGMERFIVFCVLFGAKRSAELSQAIRRLVRESFVFGQSLGSTRWVGAKKGFC